MLAIKDLEVCFSRNSRNLKVGNFMCIPQQRIVKGYYSKVGNNLLRNTDIQKNSKTDTCAIKKSDSFSIERLWPAIQLEVMKSVSELANLAPDWDGYGGVTPSYKAIEDAKYLANMFFKEGCFPNRVGASGDGEIGFFWDEGNLFADFGVLGTGRYSYYICSDGKKLYGDDLLISEPLPREVIDSLKLSKN